MSKRPLLFIALFGLICAFNGAGWAANPGLVGWWSFDEGAGDIAGDGSGNGNHGQIVNATWTEGQLGSALDFDGTAYVEIPPVVWHGIDRQATLAFWVYGDPAAQPQANFIIAAFVDPGVNGARAFSAHIPWSNSNVYFDTGGTTTNTYDRIQKAATPDEFAGKWQHWALVKNADTGDQSIYLNGALWHTEAGGGNTRPINGADVTGFTVGSKASHENFFVGMIDDVQLYDVALTEGEILLAMEGISTVQAGTPTPEDGAVDVARDVGLSWAAGEFAKTHNVFLGTAFEDANDATVADPKGVMLGQGLTDGSIDAGRLDFGQTYYWRVDEVNGAPDLTVYKGAVWNFEVEPFSIPIDNVTATASSSFGDSGPEKTLDGSGLVDDLHGVSATDMWISAGVPATIEYAFDRAYKLHELWIWNSNQLIEAFVGFGAKDVVIEHSLDGENWTVLDGVGPLAQ
ncbi:MAG: LamG domain-containing protein, partial [Planctomycetes bacterium]|nr:LamG domain-containing protein [Planctomycetota bacterium]